MPYQPGISYDTQSLGQGIQQAGQNIATGIREMQANKLMATQAIGRFEGALAANPEILQFLDSGQAPTQAASAYKSLVSGGTLPAAKAAMLAQFADTFASQKQAAQEAKIKDAQIRQFAQKATEDQQRAALVNRFQNINAGHSSMYNNATMKAAQSPMGQVQGQIVQATGQAASPAELLDYDAKVKALGGKPAGTVTFKSQKDLDSHYPATKWDYSDLTPNPDGTVTVKNLSPRAPAIPTLEAGYEPDPNVPGAVRPIKGSGVEAGLKAAEDNRKAMEADSLDNANVVLGTLDRVMPKINGLTAGAGGAVLGAIPGTDAKNTAALIDTIKGQIGFDRLQKMRANSKSGASGLGQLSVKEMEFLQALQGNLSTDQSPAQLSETLGQIKTHFDRFKATLEGRNPDEAASGKAPSGVDPAIWNVMTPAERALWK